MVSARQFSKDGKIYLEVLGRYPPALLNLRSGSPTYVFDESGRMVDWTADRGDAPAFVRKWGSLSNATFITIEEARQLAKTNEH